jgi:hypothetical protein
MKGLGERFIIPVQDFNEDIVIKIKSDNLDCFCPLKVSSLKENYLESPFLVFKNGEVPIAKLFIKSEFKPNK